MTKTILGLDIGVSSIGMAVVKEDKKSKEIQHLAVRVIPEDPNFHGKFYSGNTASKNLERTLKRGIRRNNQRFKARRDRLYQVLKQNNLFPSKELFQLSARELYGLRAKAVTDRITLEELGRILILLNQRRGFLSNRKSVSEEENSTDYKKRIAELEQDLGEKTIGQRLFEELEGVNNPLHVVLRERTYLRSSYLEEFDRIWDKQREFHPDVLTGGSNEDQNKNTLYDLIRNRTIFYQRPLKSQKGLVSECPFEKYHKAVAKSSPYFELFRIWQKVNDLSWKTADGQTCYPTAEQKQQLKERLWSGKLNAKGKLSVTEMKKLLGYQKSDRIYLNFEELDGSRTYAMLKNALQEAEVNDPEEYLFFNWKENDEKGGLFELWHITYSLPTEAEVINTLVKRFGFSEAQSKTVAKKVGYASDYGSLSTRAIRKLLPHLEKGLGYSESCDKVGYDHSGYKTEIELKSELKPLPPNALRNPVAEQVLNQVVNMVNLAKEKFGTFDEIRVELARELRNSAKTRNRISQNNSRNKRSNDKIRDKLKTELGFKLVNGRDVKRYILWEETKCKCLYCNNPITGTDMLNGNADIEHILPKSRSFSNAMNNYILSHRKCNSDKGQRTAYDFMESKGEDALSEYIEKVNTLYADGKGSISRSKFENLMCRGEDIPSDFVERMKKDSQYIARESVKMLKTICPNVHTTTGQVTDFLRDEWELSHTLQELGMPKYEKIDQTDTRTIKTKDGQTKEIPTILNWSKRDDHRHHAIDALICALTDQKIIFHLNNLNKIYQFQRDTLTKEEIEDIEKTLDSRFSLKDFADQVGKGFAPPIENLRAEAKRHLENTLISFKKENSKVLTRNVNRPKNTKEQITWVPRARLHEETVLGSVKRIAEKPLKLNAKISVKQVDLIASPELKELVTQHLQKHEGRIDKAFSTKELKKNPLRWKGEEVKAVPIYEEVNTKRVKLGESITNAQISKIIDNEAKRAIEQRLEQHDGKIKEAFKNIEENPVFLKNGHPIKSVKVYDESKVIEISQKADHFGSPITDEKGRPIPAGYVKTGGNHHALIYLDKDGNYRDKVISFWEAVGIGLANVMETDKPYPIINRSDNEELGSFQFSMQINDLFVLDLKHAEKPQNENELNLFDKENRKRISDRLFRVQKLSKNSAGTFQVDFRHHLETTVNRNDKALRGIAWERFQSNQYLKRLTKVRLNHLGDIIKAGE